MLKIVKSFPPNIDQIKSVFTIPHSVVFTYGDILYNPTGSFINSALMIHEETHQKQQDSHPDIWWSRYLIDPDFRLDQEVEAYRNQYQYMQKNIKDPFKLEQQLTFLANDLSSPMYGSIIPFYRAKELILC